MTEKNTDRSFEQHICQTLQLAEERGYNLTIEQLTSKLIGGAISEHELRHMIPTLKNIDVDHDFIATKGNLYLKKCEPRQQSNVTLQPYYQCIATRFINEYTWLCPWVTCILISGSMASEGLGKGDDIDFDLIVPDGLKYTSYLLALLLSFKYSLLYGKDFWRRYVICISVIWETHQVLPFHRNDGQLAFELLNAKVVYNPDFFTYLVNRNEWLKNYFPQMFQENIAGIFLSSRFDRKCVLKTIIERFSKNMLFLMVKVAMSTVFNDHNIKHRMMIKYPYALFDEP
jgi:hypothetical protein